MTTTIEQLAETLEQAFRSLTSLVQQNGHSRATRRKLLKATQACERAASIVTSCAEDQAEERRLLDKPEKKTSAKKKAKPARAHTAAVRRSKR
jgi:hypothetical protein